MKGEDSARQLKGGKKGCWNQEEEEGHFLRVAKIGL